MGFLLRCLGNDESKNLMGEIHEGVCGAHQSAFKMKWLIRRNEYFWPTILEDCFKYFKGCQGCQKFGNIKERLHRLGTLSLNPGRSKDGLLIFSVGFIRHQAKGINLYSSPPIISLSGLKQFL